MGLFSIRGGDVQDIQQEIWYPDMTSHSEKTRVFTQPGFKARYDAVIGNTESIVEVFSLNKTIKSDTRKVVAGRPGIVARLDKGVYEVHLPVQRRALDIASMAVSHIQLAEEATDPAVHGPHAGRLAVALAVHEYINDNDAV